MFSYEGFQKVTKKTIKKHFKLVCHYFNLIFKNLIRTFSRTCNTFSQDNSQKVPEKDLV